MKQQGSGEPHPQAMPVRWVRFLFMRKLMKIVYIFIAVFLITSNFTVFADDNIEEEIEWSEIDSAIKSASSEAKNMPVINSRHAVVIDRTSRKSFIRKKRK